MFQIIIGLFCLFLFAMSLSMFSKSAFQRARARTEFFYAFQIREEAEAIRLQNEKTKMAIVESPEEAFAEVVEENVSTHDLNPTVQDVVELPIPKVELKELELDEKAIQFISQFQPKQEEIALHEVTIYEKPKSWFNFREVDLHMNERPEKGLYYVAGKVMDVLDDMTAIISDGTGERMLYHHKVQSLTVGNIIVSQVEVIKGVWNFITVWEINEVAPYEEKAM
jgi:hypothetical protein